VIAAVVPVPAPAQVGQHDRLITGLQLFAGASAQGRRLRITHASVIRVHDALAWAEACCVVRVCALEVRTVTRAEIPPQAHLNRSRNLPTMWSKTLLASFQLTDSARGVSAHQTIGVRERTRTLLPHGASAGVSTAV